MLLREIKKNNYIQKIVFSFIVLLIWNTTFAGTFYCRANGSWSSTNTWSTTSCSGSSASSVPGIGDDVYISGCWGRTVTMDDNVTVENLYINDGGLLNRGTFNLTVNNILDLNNQGKISGTTGNCIFNNVTTAGTSTGNTWTSGTVIINGTFNFTHSWGTSFLNCTGNGYLEFGSSAIVNINSTATVARVRQNSKLVNTGSSTLTVSTEYDYNCNADPDAVGTSKIQINAASKLYQTPCATVNVSESALSGFSYCTGSGPSSSQTFTVDASGLLGNIDITATSNYEVSTDNSSYSSTISLDGSSGSIASTTIYARLKNSLAAGDYSTLESVTVSTTGADDYIISLSGNVLESPSISASPSTSNSTYCFNEIATDLSVTASGDGLTYAWYSNTSPANTGGIALGISTSTLTPPTNASGSKYYYCIVDGTCSSPVSSIVSGQITTLNQIASPNAITSDSPTCESAITFTMGTCNEGTCYWVSSPTGTETTNTDATITTAATVGSYNVYVRSTNGSCWSDAVSATGYVNANAAITTQPSTSNQTLCLGDIPTDLTVVATGGTLDYQWYSNSISSNTGGTAISGATSSTYTPSTTTAGTKYYYCTVGGNCGPTITSNVSGFVTINPLPTVSLTTNSPVLSTGTLELTGGADGMTTYSWTGPNSYTSSSQSPTINTPSNLNEGTYTLEVTDANSCTNSTTADVIIHEVSTFYSKNTGELNNLLTWGKNTNGSGASPTSFTDPYQTFIIRNNLVPTITNNWTVGGTDSKIIVGNSSSNINFTIPSTYSLTTQSPVVIDVTANATLTIENTITPNLGTLDANSTVVYNGTGAQNIQDARYYNLTINNSRSNNTITLDSGYVTISNVFNINSLSNYNISATNNTIIFDGENNQNIPAFTYNNLHTELGGTKTLTGNIVVLDNLRIGAITSLNAASYTIDLQGSGEIVTLVGTFIPSTSTVLYSSASNAEICAMEYYILDATGGDRTLQNKNIITLHNTFTPGVGNYTITGSTVLFNGSALQSMPAFNFNNLQVNNSTGVSFTGNVTVIGNVLLYNGIVNMNSNSLTITNTSSSAINAGSASAHINGALTRYLPANLTAANNKYIFPIGKNSAYYPFTMSSITTGATTPIITIDVVTSNCGGFAGVDLLSISSTEYWDVNYTGSFSTCKVALGRSSGLGVFNSIGHSSTLTGIYDTKKGTISGNEVINSDITTFSYFVLGQRTVSTTTYYSRVGTGLDLSDRLNWTTNSNGIGGTSPTAAEFIADDVTFNIVNTTDPTILHNWNVSGSGSSVVVGNGAAIDFSIPGGIIMTVNGTLSQKANSTVNVTSGSALTINDDYIFLDKVNSNYQTLNNDGYLTINGNLSQPSGSFSVINNNSTGLLTLNGDFSKGQNTWFYNSGNFNINSGSMDIISNYQNVFENLTGGVLTIDNSASPGNSLYFDNINFNTGFVMDVGSTVMLINTDLDISNGAGTLTVEGELIIEDGDLNYTSGGATLNVPDTGGLYIYDTDNNGDGILDLSNGGIAMNVDGEVYIEGLTVNNGGGSSINVTDGGEMFVGNVGLYTGLNNNEITVYSGGILNYCGNKTPTNENMGTINAGGTLNYASGYYTTETPGSQDDFIVNGSEIGEYANAEACRAAFYTGTPYSSGTTPLPIELSMLYGNCSDEGNISINWQTASEKDNDYFTLFRSYNGKDFEYISTISGAGDSKSIINYNYNDIVNNYGLVYYRLMQTDYDGTTSLSKIIAVQTCGENSSFVIFEKNIEVIFEDINTTNQVMITDLNGKILYSKTFSNVETALIPIEYAQGIYIISNITPSQITSQKFVK